MGHELINPTGAIEAAAAQAAALEQLIGATVVSLGVDVIEIDRIRRATSTRERFVRRVYTDDEARYCRLARDPGERFAARFAAKEATMKALGVGLGGVDFRDMSVRRSASGAPSLRVVGRADTRAAELGITRWLITLSHSDTVAMAVVAGLGA